MHLIRASSPGIAFKVDVSDIEDHLRTPESRALLARYRQAQAAGPLPHVRLIDSETMRTLGRDLALVEKSAHGEFSYLYFGEALKRLTGTDLTGRSTAHQATRTGAKARSTYLKVLELRAPLFTIDRETENGRVHLWGRLHLPFDDGRGGIVICSYNRPREYTDELLRDILDSAADGILAIKAVRDSLGEVVDGTVLAANAQMLEILRRTQQEVLSTPVSRIFPGARDDTIWDRHLDVLLSRRCHTFEVRLKPGGVARWYRVVSAPLNDGIVLSFSDITELKQLNMALEEQRRRLTEEMAQRTLVERNLRTLVNIDPLTNVANRRSMQERAVETLKLAAEQGVACTMIIIDIDLFKQVNDSFGHCAGDRVIQHVARIAQGCCRDERDVVARMGGEEFAMLLYNTTVAQGVVVAERLRRLVERTAMVDRARESTVTVSCGVAERRDGQGYEELLAAADRALYGAKHSGRNRTHTDRNRTAA